MWESARLSSADGTDAQGDWSDGSSPAADRRDSRVRTVLYSPAKARGGGEPGYTRECQSGPFRRKTADGRPTHPRRSRAQRPRRRPVVRVVGGHRGRGSGSRARRLAGFASRELLGAHPAGARATCGTTSRRSTPSVGRRTTSGMRSGTLTRALELLAWWRSEVEAAWDGCAAALGVPGPFRRRSIASGWNRKAVSRSSSRRSSRTRRWTRYESWDGLLDYCRRSADPVGRTRVSGCSWTKPGDARHSWNAPTRSARRCS